MDDAKTTVKTWEKTRLQNLVRHKSGKYYARLYLNGKEIWKSLKTSHFSIAEARLADFQREHRQHKGKKVDGSNARMTFGDAATLKLASIENSVVVKSRTRKYWQETVIALKKSWPELFGTEIRRITSVDCRDWSTRYAKTISASRFNGAITTLRQVFDLAIESGAIYSNPVAGIERRAQKPKELELPSRAKFVEFVTEIRSARSRFTQHCADLVEGLAYTGLRINESRFLEWQNVSFQNDEIAVKGDPEEGTKNGEIRYVPMIRQAHELFLKMRESRKEESLMARVFLVRECQKSMNRAAEKVGMVRITHHDLRHLFATICIESGVDIPTVSRWLGHKDGGALAMRTYGHLRREHSIAQAKKVTF